MGLLLDYNNDIAWLGAGILISFTIESILVLIRGTLVNYGLKDFLLLFDLLTIADLALVFLVNNLALASAVIAGSLGLGVHAGSQLGHFGYHTTTSASATLLHCAIFTALSFARVANSLSVDSNFGSLSIVDFFQSYSKGVHDRLALFGALRSSAASAAHAAEHATKEVIHATWVTTTTFLDSFLSVLVVKVSLLSITEHFICSLDLLELFLVTTSVGVMLNGELAESLPNVVI